MQNSRSTNRTALLAVLALGLVLRLAVFFAAYYQAPDLSRLHQNDTADYILPAESLLEDGRFETNTAPEFFRTPGYPILLIPGLVLGHVELVTYGLQLLLSLATIWLVYKIALELLGNPTAALGGALLMAVEPLSILYTSLLLSETLFTFLFVLFLRHLLRVPAPRFNLRSRLRRLAVGGGHVRPGSYALLARSADRRASAPSVVAEPASAAPGPVRRVRAGQPDAAGGLASSQLPGRRLPGLLGLR